MRFSLGLTGSIGMGKSTTAKIFAELGCKIWDADAAVHRLYSLGGAAVGPIGDAFPTAIKNGAVDRGTLKDLILNDKSVLDQIESIVHPLVQSDRQSFRSAIKTGILVFDIPLLFETGSDTEMDAVACVYVDPKTQQDRVLARGTMSASQFDQILSKQLPIDEKLRKSDYKIETDSLPHARDQVSAVLDDIRRRMGHA